MTSGIGAAPRIDLGRATRALAIAQIGIGAALLMAFG